MFKFKRIIALLLLVLLLLNTSISLADSAKTKMENNDIYEDEYIYLFSIQEDDYIATMTIDKKDGIFVSAIQFSNHEDVIFESIKNSAYYESLEFKPSCKEFWHLLLKKSLDDIDNSERLVISEIIKIKEGV